MKDESIAIELRLTAEEIAMLADESESTENPELAEFLSKVLRLTDKAAYEMGNIILKIKKANPYTNQHKEM
ncbi:MAG: hypothetical protein IJ530_01005 [Treponema sp.]|uniref:hypothetical protein n=1 Tax=Treponema sp. TaxID=166 RepID=UPI0025F7F149|nr:hypothetical protein [Treponema sp.]MBQ8678323.1 hypothetical protein [Treponema sp.]